VRCRLPSKGVCVPSGGPIDGLTARIPSRRGKRWRKPLLALAGVIITFCAATARLFVWPDQGIPPRVSTIVMLDGPGDALSVAVRPASQHRAPFLVVSQGTPASHAPCPRPVPGVTLVTRSRSLNVSPVSARGHVVSG
jgi:hypothetical protein